MPGTLDELRVRAFLDLLQERDSRETVAETDDDGDPASPASPAEASGSTDGSGAADGSGARTAATARMALMAAQMAMAPAARGPGPGGPGPAGGTGGTGHGRTPSRDNGPSLAALINITIPWSARQGRSETPADVAGFGLVHAHDARDLIAAAARDPRTRWCVTGLHPDGTAAAHGCAHGRHPPPAGLINLTGAPTSTSTGTGTGPGPGPDPPQDYLHITMTTIARGHCDHEHAETRYKPSRTLQHLLRVRNARCTAPGCSRPRPAATWTTPSHGTKAA